MLKKYQLIKSNPQGYQQILWISEENMEVEIELPWPPSVNTYKNIGRTIRTKSGKLLQKRVNSPETTAFYYQVFMKIKAQGLKTFAGATIVVEVDAYPPDARRRDISNILKVLEDSLQRGGLFDDDFQICRLTVQRMGIIPRGKVIVRIKELQCT